MQKPWSNFLANLIGESESHSVVSDSSWPHGLYSPWNSPGWNTGVFSCCLLQGVFPTQGSNPGLPHGGRILYQLSHQGSPRILEWVAYPFSRGFSRHRNQTGVSSNAGRFFTNWATREARLGWHHQLDGHECEQAPGVGDGQGSLACRSPWGCKESDTTERLNWTKYSTVSMYHIFFMHYSSMDT